MKIVEYCLVVFSIITSGSLVYMTHNDDLILIINFLFALVAFLIVKIKHFNRFYFYYALLVVFFLVIHFLYAPNSASLVKYIGTSLKVITFLLVITIVGQKNFLTIYPKTMFVLCSINLIFYFDHVYLFSVSQPISSLLSQLTTWSGNIYYENYIFYVKPVYSVTFDTVVNVINKNSGIFGEGGLYQYFINIALAISIFYNKKSIFHYQNIVFIFSIITTFSTIAYLNLFFIVLINLYNPRNKIMLFFLFPFILAGSFMFFNLPVIYNKFFNVESYDFIISTQRRMIDTMIDLKIIQDQPFLGIGLGNFEDYNVYTSQFSLGGASSSNGILNYIAKVGLIGTFISLYPFFIFGLRSKKKIAILICNILTGLTQGIIMAPVFLLSASLFYEKPEIR